MRQRQIDSLTYSANAISTIDIPRAHWGKKLTLLLVGQCDSGSAVSRSTYNPFEIIKRVEIVANGSQTIKSVSGKSIYLQNIYEHGTVPNRTQTPSSTSQSNQAFGGAVTIYFDKDTDYIETLLPTHILSSLQLKITWGAATDIDSGSGFNIDSLVCYPLLTEEINVGQSTDGVGVLKELELVKTISASGWMEVELPIGNVYQRVKLLTRDNTAASNTIVSEYEIVKDDLEIIRKVRFDQSRAEDLIEYAVEAANQPTGYTVIDFDLGGSAPINTKGWSTCKLRLNVSTSPTSVADATIVTEEIILPTK